jgi:hypothetical protein
MMAARVVRRTTATALVRHGSAKSSEVTGGTAASSVRARGPSPRHPLPLPAPQIYTSLHAFVEAYNTIVIPRELEERYFGCRQILKYAPSAYLPHIMEYPQTAGTINDIDIDLVNTISRTECKMMHALHTHIAAGSRVTIILTCIIEGYERTPIRRLTYHTIIGQYVVNLNTVGDGLLITPRM